MNTAEYYWWVNRLAQYDLRGSPPGSPRDKAYSEMVKAGVPLEDRVAISKAACKLFEERKPRPVDPEAWEQEYECSWVDEAAPIDLQFNTEGEKQMEKIDWHKPLRSLKPGRGENPKVYTYKSGKQRVVWIDDRVYPVDEQGRAVADVDYGILPGGTGWVGTVKGVKIVENVPEEKFFLGLARDPDGTYWLTDGGTVSNIGTMNYWKKLMGDQPHWIVDTRKPAEPPKAIEHDPEDYVTIWTARSGKTMVSGYVMTKAKAEAYASEPGEQVVRVRTTPPADTARYIQLWRTHEGAPWTIDKCYGSGRQELTWAETRNRETGTTRCAIKVRD